jgi:hypothetical protein
MVACGGLIDRSRRRIVGSRPHGQSSSLANTSGQTTSFRGRTGHGFAPDHVRSREHRTRGMPEQALEGNGPGEHRPRRPTIPGQGRVVARTDSRGEQGFEAGVPIAESGEPGPIRERVTHTSGATRHARRPSDSREPSSRLLSPASRKASCGTWSARKGKGVANVSDRVALLGGRTRTCKEARARESGYGSSRRESSVGRLQRARAA